MTLKVRNANPDIVPKKSKFNTIVLPGKMVAQEQTEIQAKSVLIRPHKDWVRSG